MRRRIKSLQLRLTAELAALFFLASCLAVGGLIYSASLTAGSVADRELELRAEDLARYVSRDDNAKPQLHLPATLQQAYTAAAQQSVFAIRDQDGRLIEASTPGIGATVARWPPADSEPSYFRLSNFGPSAQDYSGVSIRLESAVAAFLKRTAVRSVFATRSSITAAAGWRWSRARHHTRNPAEAHSPPPERLLVCS